MADNDEFWEFYWETRLQSMENLGKKAAILAGSRLIRLLAERTRQPIRILELGCGEGQVIGALVDAHHQWVLAQSSVAVDYNKESLARCHRDYPLLKCVEGDFTRSELLAGLGQFEIVMMVNALHEVFSAGFSQTLDEVDAPAAKVQVVKALAGAAGRLAPDGWLVLFDGLEPPGDPQQGTQIRFLDDLAYEEFKTFARQYHPFHIAYRELDHPLQVELSRHDFTRYITKSIFLGKHLWETERFESYQYFTEEEFRASFKLLGLQISQLQTMTMNDEKWRSRVEICTSGVEFPAEHILILAQMDPTRKG